MKTTTFVFVALLTAASAVAQTTAFSTHGRMVRVLDPVRAAGAGPRGSGLRRPDVASRSTSSDHLRRRRTDP